VIRSDAVIIGAGPVGLFQVFELGLLGLHAHVVDSMPHVGGQCAELYPDKPIYDIPAIPVCSAHELIERLKTQIRPFNPQFHLGETVVDLHQRDDGRFYLATSSGTQFDTATVIIAAGLGAFTPRKLTQPEAEGLNGISVHYKVSDSHMFEDRDLVIAGGGDAAVDWAAALVDHARSIVVVHRSSAFRAAPAAVKRVQALCEAGRMQILEGDIVGLESIGHELKSVRVRTRSGMVQRIETEHLLVFWGLHPALGPIAEWGLTLDRSQVVVDAATFQSSTPGIFAVGDIAMYPGKKKLILSGFHEAALCAYAVWEQLNPGEKLYMQYTTTSPTIHKRLGFTVNRNGDERGDVGEESEKSETPTLHASAN